MLRAKIWGYLAFLTSLILSALFVYSVFVIDYKSKLSYTGNSFSSVDDITYIAIAVPIALITLFVLGTGFWIGWTILTIKVVPPMPEIVEKKDYSKIKAFFLCMVTMALAGVLMYGIYIKNFWALAIPSAVISLVILGAVFWVGIAIITTTINTNTPVRKLFACALKSSTA